MHFSSNFLREWLLGGLSITLYAWAGFVAGAATPKPLPTEGKALFRVKALDISKGTYTLHAVFPVSVRVSTTEGQTVLWENRDNVVACSPFVVEKKAFIRCGKDVMSLDAWVLTGEPR